MGVDVHGVSDVQANHYIVAVDWHFMKQDFAAKHCEHAEIRCRGSLL